MSDAMNQLARELADAIAAAVAASPDVEACRARARDEGFDLRVTLEAAVGFLSRTNGASVTTITAPARLLSGGGSYDLTSNDRRFLRSLRIAADETREAVE